MMTIDERDFETTAEDNRPNKAERGWENVKESAAQARDNVTGAARSARENVSEAAATARDRTAQGYDRARHYVSDRYDQTRKFGAEKWDQARASADQARERTAQGITENPLGAAVLGAFAGAAIGLLLPRTQRENRTFGRTRDDLLDQANAAARAAREAGETRYNELGVTDTAKAHLDDLKSQAGDVARSARDAAAQETGLKS